MAAMTVDDDMIKNKEKDSLLYMRREGFMLYTSICKVGVTWVFGPMVIPLPKKSHPSMRVWVRSL